MKKILLTLILATMTMVASASSVRYFTRPQAKRVAATLDAQAELMIYCGYEYELATYVIINEVWAEPVNSKYYEIWLYGYDAYTGEEIYMPIDLACIWLYNAYGNRMYSAAQFLRFRSTVATPNFYWTMPPYNPFTRHFHDPHFNHGYTYHYEIHRYGWRPPMPPAGGPWPYHPYYMRTPHTPAPVPPKPFTPGVNHPQTADGHGYIGGNSRTTVGTRSTSFNNAGGARSGSNMSNAGNPGTTSRSSSTNTNTSTGSRGTSANTSNTGSRGTSTNTSNTGSRGTSTNTSNTGSRGTSANTGNTGSRGTSTNTSNTGSRGTSTNTGSRGTSTSSISTNRSSSATTPSRSSSTTTRTSSTPTRSSATSSSTSSRGSSTTTSSTSSRGSSTTGSRGTTTNSGSRNRR